MIMIITWKCTTTTIEHSIEKKDWKEINLKVNGTCIWEVD